ncbi:hypothetical protein C2869_15050 [Saccharobesus litoralis]|uniref:DNA repair protein n=1 Tax=Saccharobesus litoralis TaxID=2172099 RepID=A0A2S0VTX5_9ALTE|nr:hypothetical protein [Saccharobesus litoralis]AWB67674.1 hypothetical protein C2869_15050 [Saccharobesus litoralis]
MIFQIVIGLVVALVVLAVIMNAIQQHKTKVEADKRVELAKYKAVIEDTEELLMSAGTIPVSPQLILIMHQRVLDALKAMAEVNPESKEINQRLRDAQERVKNFNPTEAQKEEDFVIPDEDRVIITMIKAVKKLRALLRTEHTKGKVDTHLFMVEDKKLEGFQLRVNVESLLKRGKAAQSSHMLGSARQYFEKALNTLAGQANRTEYVNRRQAELETILSEIAAELKSTNLADARRKGEKDKDDLDVLFQPKKKW